MNPNASPDSRWLAWTIAGAVAVVALLLYYIVRKNRALPGEHVFRASRWTKGNRIFPAQVVITGSSVTLLQPQWIGKREESAHIAHISSIEIDTNVMFSDVSIETTGGHNPLVCHGHTRGDAVRMKHLIEQFQAEYYKK
jgi:predicted small integral membrane protein